MKHIKLTIFILFILLSMLVGFWVVSENEIMVALTLFGFSMPEQVLGVVVVEIFVVGILLGLLANTVANSLLLLQVRNLKKQLEKKSTH